MSESTARPWAGWNKIKLTLEQRKLAEEIIEGQGVEFDFDDLPRAYVFLTARVVELEAALKRIAEDMILDKQEIEYYKRLHLIHKDWARAALAKGGE